jgi:hypothetical protein
MVRNLVLNVIDVEGMMSVIMPLLSREGAKGGRRVNQMTTMREKVKVRGVWVVTRERKFRWMGWGRG